SRSPAGSDGGRRVNMPGSAGAPARGDAAHAVTLQNAERFARVPAREVGKDIRAKCRRDQAFTAQTARTAINSLYEECGGSGLFESSDLQRLWRDANAAAAHNALTLDWIAAHWTRTALDLPTDPRFLF